MPGVQNFDARDIMSEMYRVITDPHDFVDVFAPNVPFIFETVLANKWYLGFVRNILEEQSSTKTYSNRYAVACILDYLVQEKLDLLKDLESAEGNLVLQLLQMCFETLPRIQNNDLQRGAQLAQNGVPGVERVVLPYVLAFLKKAFPTIGEGKEILGCLKAVRSLFFALAATNKFSDIQSSVGTSGLHIQIVETSMSLMNSPAASKDVQEMCAEICLLVPARLEHLIPLIPKMMHAAVAALNSNDRSVHIALKVLDVWVESFNPEFIERSMLPVTKPLMTALWSHIKPASQGPFGQKVAAMLGKMGGRGRRWLGDSVSVDYKEIPEYGLRVILAFPPHTSFLVPLDRCVQLAWTTVACPGNDPHKRKNALRLLQICTETLARLHLPNKMICDSRDDTAALDATKEKNLEKLKDLLFNSKEAPEIPSDLSWPSELGVKTKKQHAAEKKMLETVLTALVSSSRVEDEIEGCNSKLFAHSTCRHFAYLMASGWAKMGIPPWAPPTSRMTRYNVLGGIPACVATLKHLQPHILLDAFEQGLKRENPTERAATVDCIAVFLDALLEIGNSQKQIKPADGNVEGQEEEQKSTNSRNKLSRDIPYLNIQQDLISRARHCCYDSSWSSRMGGVLALEALCKRMDQSLLVYASHYIVKALMTVLRNFPDSASVEIEEVTEIIITVVRRAVEPDSDAREDERREDDVEETQDEPQVTTRRGKRTKRRAANVSRKKQKVNESKSEKSGDLDTSKEESGIERDIARLQNDLLQALMSSKNNEAVRNAATKCLELLSRASGQSVGSMLDQILSRQPGAKSLLERRILPLKSIPAQTNYAHSMAFLFGHSPTELKLTDSVGAFIADCCTILEMEDHIVAASTSIRGQPPKVGLIVNLQAACLEVSVTALKWPSFRDAGDVQIVNHIWDSPGELKVPIRQLKERIVGACIQKLNSSSERIRKLCKDGLDIAVAQELLEKTKLQESFRPILADVAQISRINLNQMNHLHRLLDILPDQFHSSLGEKLIEHLQIWVDYDKKLQGTAVAWEPGMECELAVQMLDVFHKLPPPAVDFLESQLDENNATKRPGLVVLTIHLENSLPTLPGPPQASKCWSPYRPPLIRFLNKYVRQSIEYFVTPSRLSSSEYFTMFLDIIRHLSGKPLLEELKNSHNILEEILRNEDNTPEMIDAKKNCICLVHQICILCPEWLSKSLYDKCLSLWQTNSFEGSTYADLTYVLVNFVRRHHSEISTMLDLPCAFVGHSGSELTWLKEYLSRDFPRESSSETKKEVCVVLVV